MSRPTRQNARVGLVDADRRYLRSILQGSSRIRSMLDAAAMSSPPTITAAAAVTTHIATGNVRKPPTWPGFRYSGAPLMVQTTQTLTVTAGSGTYTLTVPAYGTTAAIAYNATSATIQAALRLITGLEYIVVAGAGPFTVTFAGTNAPVGAITSTGATATTANVYSARNAQKTDGSTSTWGGTWGCEFDHDGSFFVFGSNVPATGQVQVWANEVPHSVTPTLMSGITGVSGTGTQYFKVDFGSTQLRRIRLCLRADSVAPITFQGIYVGPTDGIFPPSIASPVGVIVGDSYDFGVGVDGQSGTWAGDAYSQMLAKALGFAQVYNYTGAPSTGLIKTNAGSLFGAYIDRIAKDVIPLAPNWVHVQGSVNDGPYVGLNQIGPALIAYVTALRAALPYAIITVSGPLYVAAPSAAQLQIAAELAVAATTLGVPYFDMIDTGLALFSGTGYVGATNGSGNSDRYAINVSGLHPTKAGARAIVSFLAPRIAPYLGQVA